MTGSLGERLKAAGPPLLPSTPPPPRRRPDSAAGMVDRIWPDAESAQRAWAVRQAVMLLQRRTELAYIEDVTGTAQGLLDWVKTREAAK